jgi:Macrocin-O-methyltransferase (TylF)
MQKFTNEELLMGFDPADSNWFRSTFGASVRAPSTFIASSWDPHSEWGQRAHKALLAIEEDCVRSLLTEIRDENIDGDVVEFGIFQGYWISRLWEMTEALGMNRDVYGFDSFEGLSKPDATYDSGFWKEGQYACNLTEVMESVKASERSRIKLIKGFFSDSLPTEAAQKIEKFSFVRIDCDIYRPALECLKYIGTRISDRAILVFDDWPYMTTQGEQKAFIDWLPEVPHLRFEFLFYNTWGHFYLRVHHR